MYFSFSEIEIELKFSTFCDKSQFIRWLIISIGKNQIIMVSGEVITFVFVFKLCSEL